MAHYPGVHDDLVLIDQSQLRQREWKRHASCEQRLARLLLELLNRLLQISAHELCVPINTVEGGRHDVLLCRVDRPGEGFSPIGHPIRPRSRLRHGPPRDLHHFVGHAAKEEGIGLLDVLDRVTMQVFVRDTCSMIAASVQGDIDGIAKGSHDARVSRLGYQAVTAWRRCGRTRSSAASAVRPYLARRASTLPCSMNWSGQPMRTTGVSIPCSARLSRT